MLLSRQLGAKDVRANSSYSPAALLECFVGMNSDKGARALKILATPAGIEPATNSLEGSLLFLQFKTLAAKLALTDLFPINALRAESKTAIRLKLKTPPRGDIATGSELMRIRGLGDRSIPQIQIRWTNRKRSTRVSAARTNA